VDFAPEDLRIDVARMVDDGPCAVRVTHRPTGTTVEVNDQGSTDANRDVALARLREKIPGS
jgi:protein subunit release factor A